MLGLCHKAEYAAEGIALRSVHAGLFVQADFSCTDTSSIVVVVLRLRKQEESAGKMHTVEDIRLHCLRKAERDNLMPRVMPSVWGMETRPKTQQYVNRAHYNHYREILYNKHLNDGEHIDLKKLEDVSGLVKHMRTNKHLTISEIEEQIRGKSWSWLGDTEEKTLDKVVEMAIRLWLFVKPVLTDRMASLEGVLRQSLSTVIAPTASDLRYLKPDFSAKSLIDIGDITLVYTSYLDEHLSFAETKHLRVFRHASALYHYEVAPEGYVNGTSLRYRLADSIRSLYPPNFLEETATTIQLLWPDGPRSGKARRKTCKIKGVDLEAQMANLDAFDLQNYPFWRYRLAAVQKGPG